MILNRKLFLIALGISSIVGFGLCIAGIFFAPLLIPGGVILGSSIGALINDIKWDDFSEDGESNHQQELSVSSVEIIEGVDTNNEMLFRYRMDRLNYHQYNEDNDDNTEDSDLKIRVWKKHNSMSK